MSTAPRTIDAIAAIDIAAGLASQVVGDQDREPEAVLRRWLADGADWVHVADLDRAFGRGQNDASVHSLLERHASAVRFQVSGGIEDEGSVRAALERGAARVVLSSAALADPGRARALVAIDAQRVAIGIDVRDGTVVVRGRDLVIGPVPRVISALPRNARWAVVADAARDGARAGVDRRLFADLVALLPGSVVASGGVATLADLSALAGTGVKGVVLGAALHHGVFTIGQASAALNPNQGAAPTPSDSAGRRDV